MIPSVFLAQREYQALLFQSRLAAEERKPILVLIQPDDFISWYVLFSFSLLLRKPPPLPTAANHPLPPSFFPTVLPSFALRDLPLFSLITMRFLFLDCNLTLKC